MRFRTFVFFVILHQASNHWKGDGVDDFESTQALAAEIIPAGEVLIGLGWSFPAPTLGEDLDIRNGTATNFFNMDPGLDKPFPKSVLLKPLKDLILVLQKVEQNSDQGDSV